MAALMSASSASCRGSAEVTVADTSPRAAIISLVKSAATFSVSGSRPFSAITPIRFCVMLPTGRHHQLGEVGRDLLRLGQPPVLGHHPHQVLRDAPHAHVLHELPHLGRLGPRVAGRVHEVPQGLHLRPALQDVLQVPLNLLQHALLRRRRVESGC